MDEPHRGLIALGWSDWFEERADLAPGETVARVAAVDRELLLLLDEAGSFRARLSGSFLHRHREPRELPCVGDWVRVEARSGADLGRVRGVLERRTELKRRSAGAALGDQMIAANVDVVVIVQGCGQDFNLKRLERYLVMISEGGAEPRVLLTKTDLLEPEAVTSLVEAVRASGITAPVATLSNVTREGVEALRETLAPGRTHCFVGSSGVGKSTLINHLVGRAVQETAAVSGTGEGRHTTVRRELIVLEGGALVIDNPGMREFGVLGAARGLGESFGDLASLAEGCRFRDCTHTSEPGCAVRDAVEAAEVDRGHYENFQKLKKESDFYELSELERRQRDRAFGKLVKSGKKAQDRG